ncbi:unnamed protein product [Tuwongella immobilis]|uniref:Uncharacterized protein n=1 Tax=Tuwongella immobilis TaxID=692036 RepID=A0A6C2YPV3_9BACT|nr:unnamed protein product [Tuwongella immobilis]VTS04360.1 unnamed protein product [Tuwongella immobilis]
MQVESVDCDFVARDSVTQQDHFADTGSWHAAEWGSAPLEILAKLRIAGSKGGQFARQFRWRLPPGEAADYWEFGRRSPRICFTQRLTIVCVFLSDVPTWRGDIGLPRAESIAQGQSNNEFDDGGVTWIGTPRRIPTLVVLRWRRSTTMVKR